MIPGSCVSIALPSIAIRQVCRRLCRHPSQQRQTRSDDIAKAGVCVEDIYGNKNDVFFTTKSTELHVIRFHCIDCHFEKAQRPFEAILEELSLMYSAACYDKRPEPSLEYFSSDYKKFNRFKRFKVMSEIQSIHPRVTEIFKIKTDEARF